MAYVKARCKMDHKLSVAEDIRLALRAATKSMDSDNNRKFRPSVYLFFLSWAQAADANGTLEARLAQEPWSFKADIINPIMSSLRALFTFFKNQTVAKTAKPFRELMKKEMEELCGSNKNRVVR